MLPSLSPIEDRVLIKVREAVLAADIIRLAALIERMRVMDMQRPNLPPLIAHRFHLKVIDNFSTELDIGDVTDVTFLHICANIDPEKAYIVAQVLLVNGCPVNAINSRGETALHWAAIFGTLGLARAVLEYHIDSSIKNWKNRTALHIAIAQRDTQMTSLLRAHQAPQQFSREENISAGLRLRLTGTPPPSVDTSPSHTVSSPKPSRWRYLLILASPILFPVLGTLYVMGAPKPWQQMRKTIRPSRRTMAASAMTEPVSTLQAPPIEEERPSSPLPFLDEPGREGLSLHRRASLFEETIPFPSEEDEADQVSHRPYLPQATARMGAHASTDRLPTYAEAMAQTHNPEVTGLFF